MWTLVVAGLAAAFPLAAHHEAKVDHGQLVWTSKILVDSAGPLALRRPLPKDVVVEPDEIALRDDAGRIYALDGVGSTWTVVVRQKVGDVLVPPLVPAPERVVVPDGWRFVPDASLGIEQRVGRFVAVDVTNEDEHALDDALPWRRAARAQPVLLGRATSPLLVERGLFGALTDVRGQQVGVAGAVGLFAALLIGALIAGVRLLAKRAAQERVERILDAEWRALAGRR